MRSNPPHRSPALEALYTAGLAALLGFVALTALHDERLSVDRSCVKYASARACRIF